MVTQDPIKGEASQDPVQQINQELYKRNAELAVRNKTLALLRKLDEISLSAIGLNAMAQEIVSAIAIEFGYAVVSVAYVDAESKTLSWLALASAEPELAAVLGGFPPRAVKAPISNTLASVHILAGTQREPVFLTGVEGVFPDELARSINAEGGKAGGKIQSSVIYPLFFEQKALGVLTISAGRDLHELTKYEHESIAGIVSLASLALYKAKISEDLQRTTQRLGEANRHLQELMQIKTEFLQIASHQLRTPLTSLRGLLEMQAEGSFETLPDEERRRMQKDMLSAANNLNNIVNDLLDAMELEGGKLNFTWEQVDIIKLMQEAVDTLKPVYDKKGLSINFNRQAPLPKIEADASYLRQVFLNIINNAEKYTQQGGLTITPANKEDQIEIMFNDTGIGIDPVEIPKLFGKFVRGKRSALVHTDGSGLGLFIIKKIVEEHSGSVTLKSEGVGKGTTVSVILPLKQTKE